MAETSNHDGDAARRRARLAGHLTDKLLAFSMLETTPMTMIAFIAADAARCSRRAGSP